MVKIKNKHWFSANKLGLILGFIFGALIAPSLAVLGLVSHFFEALRPLLIGPFDLIQPLIPNIQIGPNTYYSPWYKWVIDLGFNGVIYALVGGIIQSIIRSIKTK